MSGSIFKGKSTRTKIFAVITAVGTVLLLALNFLLTALGKSGQIFIDLTPEGFYSLSDEMIEYCEEVIGKENDKGEKPEIKITFCADPDSLEKTYDLRPTYFMAKQLEARFDNITVETVNITYNPAAVSMYRTTSRREITATDMIVSTGSGYKITNIANFWTVDYFSYDGEYRMATIFASLTAISSPTAYFLTENGETYYDPESPESEMSKSMAVAAELLEDRGLQVKTLKLSEVDRIPSDCALLVINAPTRDFTADATKFDDFDYASPLEKLDRYLCSHGGAIILNKAYDSGDMPELEAFLAEWGIGYGNSLVKDEESYLPGVGEEGTAIVGVYGDEDSFGGAYYGDYYGLSSAPKMVFTNSGYLYCTYAPATTRDESGSFNTIRNYADFITTSDAASEFDGPNSTTKTGPDGKKALAAASVRTYLDSYTSETTYSYLFCTNSEDFFSNELLGNRSYANYDIMASVITSISRVDKFASISLGGMTWNSDSLGGKQTQSTTLTETTKDVYSADGKELVATNYGFSLTWRVIFTVLVALPPVALTVWGIVVCIKRKNL